MKKMSRFEAGRIVHKSIDTFLNDIKQGGGYPMEVNMGDINTQEDLTHIHQEMEKIVWRAIESQYILDNRPVAN